MPRKSNNVRTIKQHDLNLTYAVLACVLIIVAGLVAYHSSFNGPFIFDDIDSIVDNPTIRQLWSFGSVFNPPSGGVTVEGRPLLNLSLAFNYALGGVDVRGYHMANLGIHVIAGLLLFGVFYKLFEQAKLKASGVLAFCISIIWTVHPIQTESVTYIIQRAESLMGLFYILSIYTFLCYRENRPKWGFVSVLVCYLGMATKEDMFSAPLIILLIDGVLISKSFKEALKERLLYYLGIFSSWALLGYLIYSTHGRGGTVGFDSGLPVWMYWVTQFPAIIHYIQLTIWPNPLVFDYAFNRYWIWHPWLTTPFALCVFGLLAVSAIWAVKRRPVGILGLFFFVLLAPTSVIPGNRQAMAEHRMYLPLAAVIAAVILLIYNLLIKINYKKKSSNSELLIKLGLFLATLLVVTLLCYTTVQRNKDYQSSIALWSKTVAAVPDNPFAHNSLGSAYFDSHNFNAAEREFNAAVNLNDHYAQAYSNLAVLYATEGRKEDFAKSIRRALELNPTEYKPRYYFALGLELLGFPEQACEQYKKTLEYKPYFADAHNRLGLCYSALGRNEEAITEYKMALAQRPIYPEVENNLGNSLSDLNKYDEAILAYKSALVERPNYLDAINNIGITYAQMHDYTKSAEAFKKAVSIAPNSPYVHNNYANILKKLGKVADAKLEYEEALRIDPGYAEARGNLNVLIQESFR